MAQYLKTLHRGLTKAAGFQLPVLLCILFFISCVSQAPEIEESPLPAAPPKAEEKAPAGAPRLPPENSLNSPRFRGLPDEAKDYLETLAEAFRKKDREFLVSQGEIQYENDLRFNYDEESYLAMLYRIGPYSEDSEWMPPKAAGPALPVLKVSAIRAIEYTGWEEKGPILEIKGRIYLENEEPLPCEIMLFWRLLEPKILGARP